MARKLKHDNLREIVSLNVHLSNPTPRYDKHGAVTERTSDVLTFVSDGKSVKVGTTYDMQHSSMLVLSRLMAQRFITSQGWVSVRQIGGPNAAKYIYHLKSEISRHTNSRLKIDNNGDGYYRIGIEADCLSFTIDDLERCDDQQVIALVKMVAMKRPEAVNGDSCSAKVEPKKGNRTHRKRVERMKRMQYRIEIAGRIFGTREQMDALVKGVGQSLAGIDAKGGITKVDIEMTPERTAGTKKTKKAAKAPAKSANFEMLDPKPN